MKRICLLHLSWACLHLLCVPLHFDVRLYLSLVPAPPVYALIFPLLLRLHACLHLFLVSASSMHAHCLPFISVPSMRAIIFFSYLHLRCMLIVLMSDPRMCACIFPSCLHSMRAPICPSYLSHRGVPTTFLSVCICGACPYLSSKHVDLLTCSSLVCLLSSSLNHVNDGILKLHLQQDLRIRSRHVCGYAISASASHLGRLFHKLDSDGTLTKCVSAQQEECPDAVSTRM